MDYMIYIMFPRPRDLNCSQLHKHQSTHCTHQWAPTGSWWSPGNLLNKLCTESEQRSWTCPFSLHNSSRGYKMDRWTSCPRLQWPCSLVAASSWTFFFPWCLFKCVKCLWKQDETWNFDNQYILTNHLWAPTRILAVWKRPSATLTTSPGILVRVGASWRSSSRLSRKSQVSWKLSEVSWIMKRSVEAMTAARLSLLVYHDMSWLLSPALYQMSSHTVWPMREGY